MAKKEGINFCRDTDTNILYVCFVQKDAVSQLLVINAPYDEEYE